MDQFTTQVVVAFAGLFPIVDPLGNVPRFIALTSRLDQRTRRREALWSTIFAAGLLIVFFAAGHSLLSFFNVSLAAVEVVGGLVVGVAGWEMVTGDEDRSPAGPRDADIAFYPMAFPILAGPGALGLALGITNRHDSWLDFVAWAVGIIALCAVTCVILWTSDSVANLLGEKAIRIITRIMGLFVLAIGAELVFNGIALEFGLEIAV